MFSTGFRILPIFMVAAGTHSPKSNRPEAFLIVEHHSRLTAFLQKCCSTNSVQEKSHVQLSMSLAITEELVLARGMTNFFDAILLKSVASSAI
jgi:hypothetical protein